MKKEKPKYGTYDCNPVKDGYEWSVLWSVPCDAESTYITKNQDNAEIISRLVKIERMLKKVKK
jgi:hypothetical protein